MNDRPLGESIDLGESEPTLLERAVEGAMDGVAILDENERYVLVNEAHATLYGYAEPAEMVGESWRICYEGETLEWFEEGVMPTLYEEGSWRGETVGVRADGSTFEQEVSLTTLNDGGLVCVVRDITERVERERELESTTTLLSTVIENINAGIIAEDTDRKVLFTNQEFCDLFGIERAPSELVGDDCQAAADQLKELFANPSRFIERTDESVARSLSITKETFDLVDGRTLERSSIPVTLEGEREAHLWVYRDVTRRTQYERRLNALHETTRELMLTSSEEQIATLVIETVTDILDMPVNGFYLYDEAVDGLVPVAWSTETESLLGTPPTFRSGNSLAWETFEAGETRMFDDIHSAEGLYNPDSVIESELQLPLGDHGLLLVASTQSGMFDETDVTLAQLLATNAETALDRAADERELRRREHALEQRNEQLEQFASVLSHDLRNPLGVAKGRLEMLDVDPENEHLQAAQRAHERMEALIEDTLTLAKQGEPIGEKLTASIDEIASQAWSQVETDRATLEIDVDKTIEVDPSRLQELFENIFRNAIEHCGVDVTVTVGSLEEDAGFYVADDGPGIPPDKHDEVFDHGYSTTDAGTGFGLAIVRQIAQAHGWTISVTASDDGGARFEIRGIEDDRVATQ